MKTTFYCVNAEFYDTREVKACMIEKQAKKKPNNQHRRVEGMQAFKIWLLREDLATAMVENLLNGNCYIDDVICLFDMGVEWENRQKVAA